MMDKREISFTLHRGFDCQRFGVDFQASDWLWWEPQTTMLLCCCCGAGCNPTGNGGGRGMTRQMNMNSSYDRTPSPLVSRVRMISSNSCWGIGDRVETNPTTKYHPEVKRSQKPTKKDCTFLKSASSINFLCQCGIVAFWERTRLWVSFTVSCVWQPRWTEPGMAWQTSDEDESQEPQQPWMSVHRTWKELRSTRGGLRASEKCDLHKTSNTHKCPNFKKRKNVWQEDAPQKNNLGCLLGLALHARHSAVPFD